MDNAKERKELVGILIEIGSAFSKKIHKSMGACAICGKSTPHREKMGMLVQVLSDLENAEKLPIVECEDCLKKMMVEMAMEEKNFMGTMKSKLN